jgi:hypothetical protein
MGLGQGRRQMATSDNHRMQAKPTDIGIDFQSGDRIEWLVADVSLARALFSGVPAARLLARARLTSDERDLTGSPRTAAPTVSTWETLQKRLLGKNLATFERVKHQVARHARAASDEGPLFVTENIVAALTFSVAISTDIDASLAEIFSGDAERSLQLDSAVTRACAAYDGRLASSAEDLRKPLFEACVRLSTRAAAGPWPPERILEASQQLLSSELRVALVRPSNEPLFPGDFDPDAVFVGKTSAHPGGKRSDRRMTRLERAELDVLLARDPRELASVVARLDKERLREAHVDSLLADLGRLLTHPGALILAVCPAEPIDEQEVPSAPPSGTAPSWLPTDWGSHEAGRSLAEAYERGAMTLPRMRAAVARGGDAAIDAIGAEMLRVPAHPFASAAFAELLARSGRARDIVRLVTYFAIAPDPSSAARALSACVAPELPSVLAGWLEAMLPSDGAPPPQGIDPHTSSAARLTACVASLEPYPHLYRAVCPLLARVSEAPAPPSA